MNVQIRRAHGAPDRRAEEAARHWRKSAQRLAFHILRSSDEDAEALADAVRDVKANLRLCSVCNNITDVDPCVYCTSPTRNQRQVCVVEEPTNIAAIEKTRTSTASITCCTARSRRCTASGRNSCASAISYRACGARRGRRSHRRHQPHRRRRSHRDLSLASSSSRAG